jgi:hypothetical protein
VVKAKHEEKGKAIFQESQITSSLSFQTDQPFYCRPYGKSNSTSTGFSLAAFWTLKRSK